MLLLRRRVGEQVVIGGDIRVTVIAVSGNHVRLGVTAPRAVSVDREEVHTRRARGIPPPGRAGGGTAKGEGTGQRAISNVEHGIANGEVQS